MTRSHWLMVVALLAMCVALAAVRAAHAASGDPVKVAWYLKGEGDVIFASHNGMKIIGLTCRDAGARVRCKLVINQQGVGDLCSRGVFTLNGFVVDGQWSAPKPCHPPA